MRPQLTELDVRYSDISDISPLAGLTSLTILDLRGNNISDVTPLAKLVNLEKLWLSENPITDISPLAGLTALRWLVIMSANLSNVTPLAKLVNLEQLLLAGNSITDFSPLLNLNNLQYADVEIPEPEPELLEVSISVPSDVQNGAFDATITFSEAVSDFVQADVSLGGSAASITSWSANSDNTVYTAAITPTASGAVTIGVAASVATDAANNSNTAATSQTVTVDVDKPTVIIGTPSGTQTGAFNATITFSETVSGFVGSEVSLSGSAASITSWSANNDNTVYTATITPTASGTITLGVAANVATDAANNPNTAATSQTVTIDVDKPTVTIGVPSGTQSSAFDTTITFSETVSGFTQSEVSLSGSAASITSWSANSDNIVYTVTITPTASGTVTIGVAANVATDAANNTNTAATSQTVTVDVDRPTVTIGVPSDTQTDAFDVTITFSESVSGFVQSDLSLTGDASASVTAWSANTENTAYTATITPTTSGAVTLNVSAGVAKDAGNNANTAATSQTVRVDVDAPSVSIAMPSGDQTGAFDVTITFSESVSGFAQTDVFVAGTASASITAWNTADDTTFTATLTPSISGTVSLSVPANVATDAANNPNTASDTQTVTTFVTQPQQVDTTSPGVNITVPSVTQRSAFDVTITFTEVVSGFVQSELSLGGTANASVTVWSANSENTVYTATITPTSSGTVILSITANVATDAAKNPNTAGTSQTVNIDIDAPSVSITVPSDVQGSAFDATITFTEVVSGFEQTDVSLTGTATASITAWVASSDNTTYTATITPTRSGTVTLNVASDVATDAANNPNTAATSQTVNIDVDAPGVSITVPSDPQNTAFNVTITFSESVSDFVQSDVTFTGDSSASITAWSANTENTTYTATITPTTSGEVTLGVSANVATDAANNPNTAATSQAVTVDVDRPTTTIGVPSGTQAGAFDATITFSETVSGFTETEISLTGSAASITSWSANSANTVYTATITPTASGTVTVSVAANVASDTAGNNNTAATSQSVTVNVPDPIPDPATWMPDANLRTAVRKALKLASDAMFTQDEMRSLTNLSAASSRISDITGLEHATQLTTLNVGGNNISDISPLAGLTALRSLDLQSANVSDVTPLANLVNLGRLYITGNPVTDFSPLSSLNSLKADVEIPGVGVSITVSQGVQNGYYWWNRSYYQNGPFEVTITFTEEVSGFEQSDLVLDYSNYTSSPLSVSITAWNTTDNITYTATMTPTTSGAVGIKVPEGVAADAADNPNTSGYTQTGIRLTVEVPDEQLAELLRLAFDAIDRSNDLLLHDYMPLLTDVSVNPLYAARRIIPSDMNISDLTGLEYATNLETLDLMGYSDVSDLTPLTGLTNLEILKLHGPDVSDFTPLSSLTNLETLNLMGYSDVSDFTPLSGLTNLETLDLESSVSDLTPLSGLTNLKTLKLYRAGNSDTVSDLTALSGLTNLETLDLRRYIVSDLTSLSGLTNLKSLKITSSSSVSSLSGLSGLTNLETLDLHWNVVSDLTPLSGLTNLKTLNLSNNSISSLTPLSSLTNLESLDLDKNSISSLRGLSGLTNLNTLSIQNNSVSDISDLSGLTNLTTLFLTGNSISDVTPLSGLTNLRRLSLARCSISDVTPLSGLTNLGRLDLSNNSISDVTPLSGLTNLGYLNLSNNSILDTSPLYTLVADHSVNVDIAVYAYWDVNTDGSVNETDENLVTAALGQTGEDIVNFRTDVNRDGTVDSADLLLVTENLDPPPDRPLPPFPFAPSALDMQALEMLDPAVIEAQLAILRAESDGSLKYLRAIALLESALAALRPDETRLLANYPNPFNPETWIPYHLANDSELSITIYDVGGTVVRRLELGHQRAGYYTSRSRAAYWDGRNEFGERVATGIYFYQLQADNMSLLRKMVILK